MNITLSDHCILRLNERAGSITTVLDIFEDAIKLVKKKKIHATKAPNPKKGKKYNDSTAYKVYLSGCHFVYSKKGSKYLLITFYQTTGRPSKKD